MRRKLNYIKHYLLALTLPLLLGTQCSTAVKHGAMRTISAPYHAVKGLWSAVTPDRYQRAVQETYSEETVSDRVVCVGDDKVDQVTKLEGDVEEINADLCKECIPWARIDEPEPYCRVECKNSCEMICPSKGLGILDRYKEKAKPSIDNKLAFRNSTTMFHDAAGVIPFQGYCSGMVSSRRKFNMNGFFEPEAMPKRKDGSTIDPVASPKEYIKFYSNIIEKIHDNVPTDIPGYSNLGEFTADPVIQDIMRQAIADEWADKTVLRSNANSTAFYDSILGRDEMGTKKSEKLIQEVEEKIKNVGSGTLYMGLGGMLNMHIVDAYKVIRVPNDPKVSAYICINDPNYSGIKHIEKEGSCRPAVEVDKEGNLKYNRLYGSDKVVQARVDHDQDEDDVMASVPRLRDYCRDKRKGACHKEESL